MKLEKSSDKSKLTEGQREYILFSGQFTLESIAKTLADDAGGKFQIGDKLPLVRIKTEDNG